MYNRKEVVEMGGGTVSTASLGIIEIFIIFQIVVCWNGQRSPSKFAVQTT